jgi:hypothetical protein
MYPDKWSIRMKSVRTLAVENGLNIFDFEGFAISHAHTYDVTFEFGYAEIPEEYAEGMVRDFREMTAAYRADEIY